MRFRSILLFICMLFLSGCASWFTSTSEPKPVTTFYIQSVHVTLDKDDREAAHGAFSSQVSLQKDFTYSIQKYLVENDIYAVTPDEHSAALVVNIEYQRRYKYGGKALSRPLMSHVVQVYQHGKVIATLKRSDYSPINGFLSAVLINFMQAIHLWDKSDEHIDADNASAAIVDDLTNKFDL